jgi:hypothetical protein
MIAPWLRSSVAPNGAWFSRIHFGCKMLESVPRKGFSKFMLNFRFSLKKILIF